jgi:hypothetical protein
MNIDGLCGGGVVGVLARGPVVGGWRLRVGVGCGDDRGEKEKAAKGRRGGPFPILLYVRSLLSQV